jgi:hypothetical protein
MARVIPPTNRFGIKLVYNDPGPIVITSADAIAFTASTGGSTSAGLR